MKYSYGLDSEECCAKNITEDDVKEYNELIKNKYKALK